MAKKKSQSVGQRIVLFLICFFLGWLGVDKFYMGAPKVGLVKILLTFIGVGFIWNIYDMICALIGRYKVNPLK